MAIKRERLEETDHEDDERQEFDPASEADLKDTELEYGDDEPVPCDFIDVPPTDRKFDPAFPIHSIFEKTRILKPDPDQIEKLRHSIAENGLINPITLVRIDGKNYTSGGELRVRACRELGHTTVPAIIYTIGSEYWRQMAEIDANLVSRTLSPAQLALLIEKRKRLYEKRYPKTKHGRFGRGLNKDRNLRPSAIKDIAKRLGRSKGDVARHATYAKELGLRNLGRIIGTSLDKHTEMYALKKLSFEEREKLIDRAERGETVLATQERPSLNGLLEHAVEFKDYWKCASEDDKREFLNDEIADEIRDILNEIELARTISRSV